MDAIETTVDLSIDEADAKIRAALAEHGFGILTEIDVAATLKNKIGVDRSALRILGACNPNFAHRALEMDPSVALMLPCNVVLDAVSATSTKVSVADPRQMMPAGEFAALADEAAAQLTAAVAALG
jgi:uncharacterized protein (DUF302 family)